MVGKKLQILLNTTVPKSRARVATLERYDKRPFGARAFDSLVFLLGLKFVEIELLSEMELCACCGTLNRCA
jgi:hypothetical protein